MVVSPKLIQQSLVSLRSSREFRDCFPEVPDNLFARVMRYGAPVGSRIEVHDRIPRCMGRLRDLIGRSGRNKEPVPCGTVVMAHELANGSGRFDREWFAPRGGLWLALAWADTLLPDYSRLLPLAAGSACCQAVQSRGVDAKIKWVNDIHWQGRKIGGILCETFSGGGSGDRYHIIGIGINCNNIEFPVPLQNTSASIREILGAPVALDEFVPALLGFLTWHFGLVHLHEEQSLAFRLEGSENKSDNPVIHAWRKLSDTPGRKVVYGYDVVRQPLYTAVAGDVDPGGGLVLTLENGETVTETGGEILYL
jgi:BirA family transcriptional regulator, biotin operon repressor / biotin---[acetyl-CoA-carboxylase] ligase